MFRLPCKSIVTGSSVRASSVHSFLENPSILSCLRYISSVNTDDDIKEHSFTVSYLMNKCGFSLKSALEVSKQVHFETPDKPDSVLAVFKNYGFSKSQILNLVRRRPPVLLSRPNTTLLPKLEFFQSKGFSSHDVIKIISSYPWVLMYSLENKLVPAFDFLENLLQSDAVVIIVIMRSPRILNSNVENMACIVDVLRDNGVL
jgi:mTERF domain-containing protein